MVKPHRGASQPHHWVAYSLTTGRVMFPARENGWFARLRVCGIDPARLLEAPLRLCIPCRPDQGPRDPAAGGRVDRRRFIRNDGLLQNEEPAKRFVLPIDSHEIRH
jgi:hypothetical protein